METSESGGGEGKRGGCDRIKSIRPTPRNVVLFMLPGADPDGNRQQLDDSYQKLSECEVDLGILIADLRVGEGRHADHEEFLLGSGSGDANFRFIDVGGERPYGEYPGWGSTTGWHVGSWVNFLEMSRRELELLSTGKRDDNGGSGVTRDWF